jgi:hypothetical protein
MIAMPSKIVLMNPQPAESTRDENRKPHHFCRDKDSSARIAVMFGGAEFRSAVSPLHRNLDAGPRRKMMPLM